MRGVMKRMLTAAGVSVGMLLMAFTPASAAVFNLTADAGEISMPDGAQIYMWSFRDSAGGFRYPGPVLDVLVGDTVTVNLTNALPDMDGPSGPMSADAVSLLFPGHENVEFSSDGGVTWAPTGPAYTTGGSKESLRSLAGEAAPGQTVSYRFVAAKPGTYTYYSGTYPHKHVDMGLVGAIIVRTGLPNQAYFTTGSNYDYEVVQFYSAVDPDQHKRIKAGLPYQNSAYLPQYWFVNGRAFPDTIAPDTVSYLPNQPMGALLALYPKERLLVRMVTFDRDMHPLHSHGNHLMVLARNGRPLSSDGVNGDLAIEEYTQTMHPGDTQDGIFTWDPPMNFGFDVYGGDVTQPVPVIVPPEHNSVNINVGFGQLFSGTAYLGHKVDLGADAPINLNAMGEMYVPFHSHFEIELQNEGVGPGGMLAVIMICVPTKPCPGHP